MALVTSAFHMPRSIGSFRKAGVDADAVLADWQVDDNRPLLTINALDRLGRLDLGVHEYLGLIAYWATGRTSAFFRAHGKKTPVPPSRRLRHLNLKSLRLRGSYSARESSGQAHAELIASRHRPPSVLHRLSASESRSLSAHVHVLDQSGHRRNAEGIQDALRRRRRKGAGEGDRPLPLLLPAHRLASSTKRLAKACDILLRDKAKFAKMMTLEMGKSHRPGRSRSRRVL